MMVNGYGVQQRQCEMHSQEHQQYTSMNHAAQTSELGGGSYPHRLVVGDYIGRVSAGAKKIGSATALGVPASAQPELASEDYDFDLLGGMPPDHHYSSEAVGSGHSAERMEIEDIIPLPPLIVLDGANVAYAYGKAKSSANTSREGSSFGATGRTFQADAEGILIACNYFINAGCRVQVVLPAP